MSTVSIPKQQKAAIKKGEGHDSKAPVEQIEVSTPSPSEILVKINWHVSRPKLHASANRRSGLAYAPPTNP